MASQFPQPISGAQSSIPSSWALVYTDAVAQYAQQLWARELQIPGAPQPVWNKALIEADVREEILHLVKEFGRAYRNPYYLNWSCKAYNAFVGGQDGDNDDFEFNLAALYPPLDNVVESGPACIVDKRGAIGLFLVPDALMTSRQAKIFESITTVNATFEKAKNRPLTKGKSGIWRQGGDLFAPDGAGLQATPGLATFGIRQMQGHERGVIALFLVPDALMTSQQAKIFGSITTVNATFEKAKNRPLTKGKSGIWRQGGDLFAPDGAGLQATPGLATFGIRQMQGHEKPGEDILVAADLGKAGSPSASSASQRTAQDWVSQSLVFGGLMSAALSMLHPEQYALSRECMIRLALQHPDLESMLKIWPFTFNALALVSNRATPIHRDRHSGDADYLDGMCTIGGDGRVAIEFKGLGFKARYRSGTMAWTSYYMHLHSVSHSPDAERIAFAAYVKQSVQLDTGLDPPRTPTLSGMKEALIEQIKAQKSKGRVGK
ncbi:unnamed protein product [Peniophora sp. CBMAI 1063]|nr:unnamed protein product [Peniophora sp. CBMAI 1063]